MAFKLNTPAKKATAKKSVGKKLALPGKKATARQVVDDDGDAPPVLGRGRPAKLSAAKSNGAGRPSAASLNRKGWGDDIDQGDFVPTFRAKADSETVIGFREERPYANVMIHWIDQKDRPEGRRSFPCIATDQVECPLCEIGLRPQGEHRYNIVVLSEDEPVAWSYTPPKTVHNKIKGFASSGRTKPLPKRWYLLAREGSTMTTTRYELTDYRRPEDVLEDYAGLYIPSQEEIDALKLYSLADFEEEIVDAEMLQAVADEITGRD